MFLSKVSSSAKVPINSAPLVVVPVVSSVTIDEAMSAMRDADASSFYKKFDHEELGILRNKKSVGLTSDIPLSLRVFANAFCNPKSSYKKN